MEGKNDLKRSVFTSFGWITIEEGGGGGAATEIGAGAHAMQELALMAMTGNEDSAVEARDITRALYVFADWVRIGAAVAQLEVNETQAKLRAAKGKV